jgi:hypothetical protein
VNAKDIEPALSGLAGYEAGSKFQRLAFVLARLR